MFKNDKFSCSEAAKQTYEKAINSQTSWTTAWSLYVDSSWFRALLSRAVSREIYKYDLPVEWRSDLEQEAMIYFAKLLQKDKSLGFNEEKGSLDGWLYLIIRGCGQKAIRQFKDSLRMTPGLKGIDRADSKESMDDLRATFVEELNALPQSLRHPLFLYWQGNSVKDLAQKLDIGERTAYRRIEEAMESIAKKVNQSENV